MLVLKIFLALLPFFCEIDDSEKFKFEGKIPSNGGVLPAGLNQPAIGPTM